MKCNEELFLIKVIPDYIKFNNYSYSYNCKNKIFKETKYKLKDRTKKKVNCLKFTFVISQLFKISFWQKKLLKLKKKKNK